MSDLIQRERDTPVEFGLYRLLPAQRLLMRNGVQVQLGGRALEILCILVRHAPNVVSKKTLFERVWPGMLVEDVNLRFQIGVLRKAFGEGDPFISTVSGRGYCFVAPLTRREAAPAPALPAKTNLPRPLTAIVARERELIELQASLSKHRLITIIGAGGVGKTRLAVELGWRVIDDFPAGVWLVDLAPVEDVDGLTSAMATALGIALPAAGNPLEIIAAEVGAQPRLLILDNCEHLTIVAAALVKTLLEKAPSLTILATSLQTLQLQEHAYPLNPLPVPPADASGIGDFGAVALFVQRAQTIDRVFALTPGNEAAVGEICRRLDGIPLALELAAARLHLLGVGAMLAGLDERLKMLRSGRRIGGRHASLLAMLEWGHGLLDPADQALFRRLGIFPASFTLDAAVAVEDAARWDVVDRLACLVDKSLVTIQGWEPVRYRLLDTLRLFARERLSEANETEIIAERHARHAVEVFACARREWETMPDVEWIARYQPEIHNLRAALEWALQRPERHEYAIALAGTGAVLFRDLGLWAECKFHLNRVIPLIRENTPAADSANVLYWAARLLIIKAEPEGLPYAEQAVALYRQLGRSHELGAALGVVGFYGAIQRQPGYGLAALQEALALLADSNLKKQQLVVLNYRGCAALMMEDFEAARTYFAQGLTIARAVKASIEGSIVINLVATEYGTGNIARAAEIAREAMPALRLSPRRRDLEVNASNLACCLLSLGDYAQARAFLEEATPPAGAIEPPTLGTLHNWGLLSAFEGRLREAAQLIGFVAEQRRRNGQSVNSTDPHLNDAVERRLNAGFQAAELAALRAEGAAWTLAAAKEFTLQRLLPTSFSV